MNRRLRILFGIVLILLILSICVANYTIFVVKEIEIRGANNLTGLDVYEKKPLFFIKTSDIEKNVYTRNPQVQKVEVQKDYPNKLSVNIIANSPKVLIKLVDGILILGEEGRILGKKRTIDSNNELPIAHYYQKMFFNQFSTGEFIDDTNVLFAIYFSVALLDLNTKVVSIDINNENMILLHTEGRDYAFTTDKDKVLQAEELRVILDRMGSNLDAVKRIDVRFDKPIITYNNI